MNKLIYKILPVLFLVLFISCEEDDTTEGVSRITYFPLMTLNGATEIITPIGVSFTDPGAIAEESGEPIEVITNISAGRYRGLPYSKDISDIYTVSYSAFNKDGFSVSVSRTLVVKEIGDMVTNLAGVYISSVSRDNIAPAQYQNMKYVTIWEKSPGMYQISDGIGAWYELGRSLGVNYGAPGATIKVNGPNNFSIANKDFTVGTFGGVAELVEFTVDPIAKTINFKTKWDAGPYVFAVQLKQVQ